MRRVVLGVLCGLLAAAGVAASDAGTLGRARESLHPVAHPAKVAKLDSRLIALRAGKVHVELLATHPGRARAAVTRRGGRVEAAYGRVIEALVPAQALAALARSRDVRFVREPVRPVPESVRGQGVAATRRNPLAQGRSARSRREDRRRRPRVQRVPPEPGHRRSPGLGGQGRLLRAGRLRRDEPRHRRRRDRGGDGARREALPRVHQGRRRARPRRRLRARPRNPDHQPLRELVQHEPW